MSTSQKDGMVFCIVEPWMTTELHLSGYDLLIFAYIHSITKDGQNPFLASAESISRKWFGDESKARTIKTSLSALVTMGYLKCSKDNVGGRMRNIYTSKGKDILTQIRCGMAAPLAPKKRRNASNSGTVPPNIKSVPYHCDGGTVPLTGSGMPPRANSGTVPPNIKSIPYHCDGGTVPLTGSGTHPHTESGTVPPHYIKEIYNKYSLSNDVEMDSQEEKNNFFIIFYFRNAKDPEGEVIKFLDYNVRKEWAHGDLNTHNKRLVYAANEWDIQDGCRIDHTLLEFVLDMYRWGRTHNIAGVDCLLDVSITGEADVTVYYITCSGNVRQWLESQKEYLSSAIRHHFMGKELIYKEISPRSLR